MAESSQRIISCKTMEDWDTYVLKTDQPVIVEFYATWCKPCKSLKKKMEEIFQTSKGWNVVIIDVNDEDVQDITTAHNVEDIPAVFLYHKGKQIDNFTGDQDESLKAFIKQITDLTK